METVKNKITLNKTALKALKIFGITLVVLISILLVVPYLFKDKINQTIKDLANENLNAKVEFSDVGVSFVQYFPAIIVYAKDAQITNNDAFNKTKLLDAKTLALGVNFYSIFNKKLVLDAVYLDDANLNFVIDAKGNANYNILKDTTDSSEDSAAELKIKKIIINHTNVTYKDYSSPMEFSLLNLDYQGFGDFSADIFQLNSKIKMDAFDFSLDQFPYIRNKPVLADIVTKVNAKELKFEFEKNEIKIKNFPFSFKGFFAFIKGGYDLKVDLQSKKSTLEEVMFLIPPDYEKWVEDMNIKGNVDFKIEASGKYMQDQSQKPTVASKLRITNGVISHKKVNKPIENIDIDAVSVIHNLDMEAMDLDVKNLSFEFNKEKTQLNLNSFGFSKPKLNAALKTKIDLEKLQKALDIKAFDVKGKLDLNLIAKGVFARGPLFRNNKMDTVIVSIPKFTLVGTLSDGYFKKKDLPQAVDHITMDIKLQALDSLIRNIKLDVNNLDLRSKDNYIKGRAKVTKLYPTNIDADLDLRMDLAEVKDFYPLDSLELKGILNLNYKAVGIFNYKEKKFPKTTNLVSLKNGYVKSLAYPKLPIENINFNGSLSSEKGIAEDVVIKINPLQFQMAGSPFSLEGEVKNFHDLMYKIKTVGTIDLGVITSIFKVDKMQISGKIATNLWLSGSKKAFDTKDYKSISNGGKLEAQDIIVKSDLLPKRFKIKKGVFKFYKDKMKFEEFFVRYGKSNVQLDGTIENFLIFLYNKHLAKESTKNLEANLTFKGSYINADEFINMLALYTENKYAADTAAMKLSATDLEELAQVSTVNTAKKADTLASGVVIIPSHLKLNILAQVDQIDFSNYKLKNFKGNLETNNGKLIFKDAAFSMANTEIAMSGQYRPIHPKYARFRADFKASNFDIQKAYAEIPIFTQMVTMAKDAYGIVSLDYKLSGLLNEEMTVDMKSIKGSGVMTLEDIKFKNFKLLNDVSKKADAKDMENAAVNKVAVTSSIKNNVLTIEPTEFKMSGVKGNMEGQVTMDGRYNIGLHVVLPPLGLIKLNFKITGETNNYDISMGKYKADPNFEQSAQNLPDFKKLRAERKLKDSLERMKIDTAAIPKKE